MIRLRPRDTERLGRPTQRLKVALVSADRTSESGTAINLGDALLTDALAEALRSRGHEVLIADFSATHRLDGTRTNVSGLRGLLRFVRSCDQVLVGGGTMLQDDVPDRVFGGLPRLCLSCAVVARIARKPITFFAVGADPISRRRQRLCIAAALRSADRVVVRDGPSLTRTERYCKAVVLGGDAALLLNESSITTSNERTGVVLALNRREAEQASVASIEILAKAYGKVSFLSMDQGPDADYRFLASDVRDRVDLIPSNQRWPDAMSVVSTARAVFASRMHALYLAALTSTPAAAVGSSPKVVSFAEEFTVPLFSLRKTASVSATAAVPDPIQLEAARLRVEEALHICGLG